MESIRWAFFILLVRNTSSTTVGCLDCSRIAIWRNSKALDFNNSRLGMSGSCANLGDVIL
jgi:hypothetical protein